MLVGPLLHAVEQEVPINSVIIVPVHLFSPHDAKRMIRGNGQSYRKLRVDARRVITDFMIDKVIKVPAAVYYKKRKAK